MRSASEKAVAAARVACAHLPAEQLVIRQLFDGVGAAGDQVTLEAKAAFALFRIGFCAVTAHGNRGSPAAIASSAAMPQPSRRDGIQKMSAAPSISGISVR